VSSMSLSPTTRAFRRAALGVKSAISQADVHRPADQASARLAQPELVGEEASAGVVVVVADARGDEVKACFVDERG